MPIAWYDELKLLKGINVCRSNTHPDMKPHVIERLATDHCILIKFANRISQYFSSVLSRFNST